MAPLRSIAVFGLAVLATASESRVTPIQKLVQMLDGMTAKGTEEKHEEETAFAEFHEWCDGVRSTRTKSIANGKAQIEQHEADIAKANADAATLAGEISDLEAAIAKANQEMDTASGLRKTENTDFKAVHTDLSESIDACQRAIVTLNARSADIPQSLMQVQRSPLVPDETKAALGSFLALHESGAPEANAYEFQSGGVVGILEKLELKFKDQLLAQEKQEMNAKANFQMLIQQLEDDVKQDNSILAKKTEMKASRLEDSAASTGDLNTAQSTKADDEKVLSDTSAQCHARSEEFEKNQVTRAEELNAIKQAREILTSSSVQGHGETYLPAASLLQASRGVRSALVQMQGETAWDPVARSKAVEFLQGRAKQLNSRYLALVAARASEDPFGKVKKMIKDLIVKLMEHANAEADSHAYCTTELATNKMTREDKSAEVEDLAARVDQLTAEISKLTSEIQELSDAIAEIKGQQHDATVARIAEKKTNAKTVADAKEAQAAVEQATQILREFFNKAADASLIQGGQGLSQAMSMAANAPYKGQQDDSTGIFGLLEVVLSDFSRLEAETSTSEDEAAGAHQKFMDESDQSVAVKTTEMEHKENKKQLTTERNASTKKELELTQEELDKAREYGDKLKAECVDNGLSYEDRKRAREEEIQSLEEALKILHQSDLS